MYQKKDVILAEQIISHVMKSQLIPKNFSPLWPAPHVQVLPKKKQDDQVGSPEASRFANHFQHEFCVTSENCARNDVFRRIPVENVEF
jgi:hypothetical protein